MPAQAEPLGDLYSVTVPYSGDNDAAFREAMRDVLIRVTGRSDAPDLPNLAPLVAQASRYVTSFRRAAGNQLTVSFNGPAIEREPDQGDWPLVAPEREAGGVHGILDRGSVEADGKLVARGPPEARDVARSLCDERREVRKIRCITPAGDPGEDIAHGLAEGRVIVTAVGYGDRVQVAERLRLHRRGQKDKGQDGEPGATTSREVGVGAYGHATIVHRPPDGPV